MHIVSIARRIQILVLLAACVLLFTPSVHAGTWSGPTYSYTSLISTVDDGYSDDDLDTPTFMHLWDDYEGDITGTIQTIWTWVPAYSGETPPLNVIVEQDVQVGASQFIDSDPSASQTATTGITGETLSGDGTHSKIADGVKYTVEDSS